MANVKAGFESSCFDHCFDAIGGSSRDSRNRSADDSLNFGDVSRELLYITRPSNAQFKRVVQQTSGKGFVSLGIVPCKPPAQIVRDLFDNFHHSTPSTVRKYSTAVRFGRAARRNQQAHDWDKPCPSQRSRIRSRSDSTPRSGGISLGDYTSARRDLQLAAESIGWLWLSPVGADRNGSKVIQPACGAPGMFGRVTDSDCVRWRCGR
jgi:hypothetical protein